MLEAMDFIEKIKTPEDFSEFCDLLCKGIRQDPEFKDLFLSDVVEAMGQWIREWDEVPEQPDWSFAADIIYAGTVRA